MAKFSHRYRYAFGAYVEVTFLPLYTEFYDLYQNIVISLKPMPIFFFFLLQQPAYCSLNVLFFIHTESNLNVSYKRK